MKKHSIWVGFFAFMTLGTFVQAQEKELHHYLSLEDVKGTLFRGQSIDGKRGVTEGGRHSAGALSFRLFCCSVAACVMRCHAWDERFVFRGEWRPSLSMGLFGFVPHAFLRFCPVFWLSMFLALQLCPLLLFLLMPEFVLVIDAQQVLDSRAENPDGRRFMRAFHVRGVGEKSGRKKTRRKAGWLGIGKPMPGGWAVCAQRPRRQEAPAAGQAGSGLGGVEATGHFVPVDDVVEGRDVVGATVLVVQVVGVLPHVQAQHRGVAAGAGSLAHQRAVLVGRAFDHQLAFGADRQPGLAAAEAGEGGLGEGVLEGSNR